VGSLKQETIPVIKKLLESPMEEEISECLHVGRYRRDSSETSPCGAPHFGGIVESTLDITVLGQYCWLASQAYQFDGGASPCCG
jgi:hypothetical protein